MKAILKAQLYFFSEVWASRGNSWSFVLKYIPFHIYEFSDMCILASLPLFNKGCCCKGWLGEKKVESCRLQNNRAFFLPARSYSERKMYMSSLSPISSRVIWSARTKVEWPQSRSWLPQTLPHHILLDELTYFRLAFISSGLSCSALLPAWYLRYKKFCFWQIFCVLCVETPIFIWNPSKEEINNHNERSGGAALLYNEKTLSTSATGCNCLAN